MSLSKNNHRESFHVPLSTAVFWGGLLTAGFYGLVIAGVLDNQWLKSYGLGQGIAIAAVALFSITMANLFIKLRTALVQQTLTLEIVRALTGLTAEGSDVPVAGRPKWLEASWLAFPVNWQTSFFGQRLQRLLTLQIKRGQREHLENDLKALSQSDMRRQKHSYGLSRVAIWALLILGCLGAVLNQGYGNSRSPKLAGDSVTTATTTVDSASLPTVMQPQAIAPVLVLAMLILLAQWIVDRTEMQMLEDLEIGAEETLLGFLMPESNDAMPVDTQSIIVPVQAMSQELIATVKQLVEQQANLWSRSMAESQQQWSTWTQQVTERAESSLGESVSAALKHHVEQMQKIQDEAARQIDTRWQQWQITLSDQARTITSQQKELIRLSDLLHNLVESTCNLHKLEEVIAESVGRLETVNRIEQSTQCMVEAVAMLATSLERAGVIRGAPIRPRAARKTDSPETIGFDLDAGQRKAA